MMMMMWVSPSFSVPGLSSGCGVYDTTHQPLSPPISTNTFTIANVFLLRLTVAYMNRIDGL